jgi:hypothetical protein
VEVHQNQQSRAEQVNVSYNLDKLFIVAIQKSSELAYSHRVNALGNIITSGDREQVVQHSCRVDDPCALMYRYESQREKERGHCSPIEISCRSSNLLGCSFCCWVVARVVALVTDRRGSFAELFRFSFGYWGNHVRSVILVVVCGVHFLFSRRKPGWNFLLSRALHAQSESLTLASSSLSKTPFRVREQQWQNI